MAVKLAQHPAVTAALAIALVVLLIVMVSPAFWQKPDKVVIRKPGCRFLGPPQPAQPEAAIDFDYALLSLAAYGDVKKDKPDKEEPCINARAVLEDEGWSQWPNFPGTDLQKEMDAVHLRAEVWKNPLTGSVVVAFGGTVFSNWKDWKSNLHWLNPFQKDEYTVIVRKFGPQFRDEFLKQKGQPGWEILQDAKVYSTGHSLGGGLAEEFAYSLPADRLGAPRVSKVYAFDPSPVTGFLSVKEGTRDENQKGLEIDRIYERGEVLAILRSITSSIHKPPADNPEVRQLRYNLVGKDRYGFTNPIASHSVQQLACELKEVARH
jgi:hypothetical protein